MERTFANARPRRPWLAALLSLLGGGPLGQVYAGHFRRSMLLWIIGGVLFPILAISIVSLPLGRVGFVLLLLSVPAFPVCLALDAFFLARRARFAPQKRYQRWWVYILVFVAFLAANSGVAHGTRAFIGEALVVPTRAMSPTILAGDRILVDKLWSDSSRLRRNDIVVYRSAGPDSPLYVTRVVGLPGDRIAIKNEQVFVNGAQWDDRHAVFEGPLPPRIPTDSGPVDIANYGPVTIQAGYLFVLGDNRRLSFDSRVRGPIPLSSYYGKAQLDILVTTAPVPRSPRHFALHAGKNPLGPDGHPP